MVGGQVAAGPNAQPALGSRVRVMLFPHSKTSAGQMTSISVGDTVGDVVGGEVEALLLVAVVGVPGQTNAVQAGTPSSPHMQ